METVFSHVIRKRYSQEYENIATDALAYILESSVAARGALARVMSLAVPGLPVLQFTTQQTEGDIRPDIWGSDPSSPRVYIESKFWAGLTDAQPVAYLESLAERAQPSLLLFIAPETRSSVLWRELCTRAQIGSLDLQFTECQTALPFIAPNSLGPIMALTSWARLLASIGISVAGEASTLADLQQLRALCDAADEDAFAPITAEQLTDQRTPALVMQLISVVREAVGSAATQGILSTSGLRGSVQADRVGQYAMLGDGSAGAWIGVHYGLWRTGAATPLWVAFPNTAWGQASVAKRIIEPWAARIGVPTMSNSAEYAVALTVPAGVEKDAVVRALVGQLRLLTGVLDASSGCNVALDGD